MKKIAFILALAVTAVLPAAGSHGPAQGNACDRDPSCNRGRGHVPGYVCYRNEASPLAGDAGNGRVCAEHPDGGDLYVFTRGLTNRTPVIVCEDGEQVYPEPDPNQGSMQCGPL